MADYDKAKKKKDPDLDRNTIKVRLPDEIIYRLVKLQMQSAACRNKGFILDGYPRTINDAKSIFLRKVEESSHQEESEEKHPGFEADPAIMPQYVVVLQGDDAQLK